MTTINHITEWLQTIAPLELGEEWDNVGLLVGRGSRKCDRVITCLTLSADVAKEAIEERCQLVVTHHPLLFRPVQQLIEGHNEGRLLLDLIEAGVAVYSPHTAYDSAADGINQQWAERFELRNIAPLRERSDTNSTGDADAAASLGAGRWGELPEPLPLERLLERVAELMPSSALQYAGDLNQPVGTLGIACGSAGEFLADARRHGCDAFITGESRFHTCLEAREIGPALILPGHYATERPALESLAERLSGQFPELTVWPSRVERDPVQTWLR